MPSLNHPSRNGGKWIRQDKRLAIYLRDGFRCVYCREDMRGVNVHDLTLDHVSGVLKNGRNNHESNLVLACRVCNSKRGALPIARFASVKTRALIKKQTSIKLDRFRKQAKQILDGELDYPKGGRALIPGGRIRFA